MTKKGIDMMRIAVAACLLFLSAGTAWGLHSYRDMELKRPGPKPVSADDSPPESAFYHPSGEVSAYGPLPANEFDRLGERSFHGGIIGNDGRIRIGLQGCAGFQVPSRDKRESGHRIRKLRIGKADPHEPVTQGSCLEPPCSPPASCRSIPGRQGCARAVA